ncbi:MAG: DUF2189 domain-containing protein [Sphingomonadaceae bacterium]
MAEQVQIAPVTVASDLTMEDLRAALSAGWQDFRAYPAFGLFFSAIYIAGGFLLYLALFHWGELTWLAPAAAGFPLLAPFAAVGLYEVSRRREQGLPMKWGAILGALRGRGDEQILMMGVTVFVFFSFWLGLAHGIFAIFMADSSMTGVAENSLALFHTGPGLMMVIFGGFVGAIIALILYSITVMSLPLLVDRDADFITAIIVSLGTVRSNTAVMLVWALIIAILVFIAMLPAFLGLLVVLPLLGHATWHLYRRAVSPSAAPVPA